MSLMTKEDVIALCEDDSKAEARPYAPEKTINDLAREREESED